jgi:hypothetical protein
MKINSIYLFLSLLFMMNCSGKTNQSGITLNAGSEKLLNVNKTEFIKVHSLKKNDNTLIGDIYVKFINDSIFTDLFVINSNDTIYSIEKNILSNTQGKDIEVLKDGFWGYKFILKKSDYLVLSCYGNFGTDVSDDITIEWNYDKNILEMQKIP